LHPRHWGDGKGKVWVFGPFFRRRNEMNDLVKYLVYMVGLFSWNLFLGLFGGFFDFGDPFLGFGQGQEQD